MTGICSSNQTMSAKEWRKVVFSNKKKFNLDRPDDFQNTGTQQIFQKRITEQGMWRRIFNDRWVGGGFASSGKFTIQLVSG